MIRIMFFTALSLYLFNCQHTPNITEATAECEIISDSGDWCEMLGPACPNPAREETKIFWSNNIADDVRFKLVILNSESKRIRRLVDSYYSRGKYAVTWNLRDSLGVRVAPGFYDARLSSGTKIFCKGTIRVLNP